MIGGSEESVWRELATLYVGDCGGDETLEILMSFLLSPRRSTPGPAGGENCEIGAGPGLGTNFLLNEGTLKFGAGGEALRTTVSGTAGGDWPMGTVSLRVITGMFCGFEDP